ncbi:MAG: MFS transporter [Desulfobaccales bacterium]|jgi:putative MFS transporter
MGANSQVGPGRSVVAEENLLARLDRAPVTRSIKIIIGLLMLAWIIEAFDIGIIAPAILIIKSSWHATAKEIGLLGSAGTFGIVIGLLPAGWFADHYGRKKVLVIGIVIFSLFTLASAAAQNVFEIAVLRFIAGLGQGAVFPVPYLLIAEFVNKQRRGEAVGWTNSLLGFAYMLASLAGFWAVRSFAPELGWRVLFAMGGGAIIIAPVLWKYLPESPRFLLKKGRVEEVRAFVERVEDEAGLPHDTKLTDENALRVLESTTERRVGLRTLLKPPYFKRCFVSYCALTAPFVVFYLSIIYGPTIFHAMGATPANSMLYVAALNFVSMSGNVIGARVGDRIGRRPAHVIWMTLAAAAVITLGQSPPTAVLILAATGLWFFGVAGFPVPKLYMAEQFPTRLRGTGTAVGEFISRLLTGVLLVYYIPSLMAAIGMSKLFIILGTLSIILVMPLLFLGIETAGRSVEETGTDLSALQGEP